MVTLILTAIIIALYLYGVRRYEQKYPERNFPWWRVACFVTGALILGAALSPWTDSLADRSFGAHMTQHVVLMLIAAPLFLLGAPLLLLVSVPRTDAARSIVDISKHPLVAPLFAPLTGWLVFTAVLWVAHFSPLYELALEDPSIHIFEHAVFLIAALLFWTPVIQVGYAPHSVAFPARLLYVILMLPQGGFLGLAIYSARTIMYPHYASVEGAARAMFDQQNGGAVMWIAGAFIMFCAFMLTLAAWAFSEYGKEPAQGVP